MSISFSRREFLGTASAPAPALAAALRGAEAAPARTAPPAVSLSVFSKHLPHLDYRALAETVAESGFDGIDLLAPGTPDKRLSLGPRILTPRIGVTTRIGISRARDAALRFFVKDNAWLSR